MKKILFVCTGNTCRSVMAEGIFNSIIQNEHYQNLGFTSESAGIMAFTGDSATFQAVKVLHDKWNIDISNHRARKMNQYILDDSFLVLSMTKAHKDFISVHFPEIAEKTFTLKEYIHLSDLSSISSIDIQDPYGGTIETYNSSAQEIYDNLITLLDLLKNKYHK